MPTSDATGAPPAGIDNRRHDRHELRFDAQLVVGGESVGVAIDNISISGAKVSMAAKRALQKNSACVLKVDDLGDFPSRVAWSRDASVGLAFEDSDWRMADAIMALAMHGRLS